MFKKKHSSLSLLAAVAVAAAIGCMVGQTRRAGEDAQVEAQNPGQEVSPTKARPRDAYFPNSEDLNANEMRVIACGTGMPTARPSQAAACFGRAGKR